MYRVILVSSNYETISTVSSALAETIYNNLFITKNFPGLRRYFSKDAVNVVLLDTIRITPLVLTQIKVLLTKEPVPVVVFTQDSSANYMKEALQAGVSGYIINGVNIDRIKNIIDVSLLRYKDLQNLKQELSVAKAQLKERKRIEKAKGILMKQKNISEEDAYKLMRSTAMENNQKLIHIAEKIISVTDLLHVRNG